MQPARETSRVHLLGRMSLLDLIAEHENLMDVRGRAQGIDRVPPLGWHRDRVIARIRGMEDPAHKTVGDLL